ncbi:MAG: hypothetical protein JWR61_1079 [Ferruginibacter sp.]|uniref:hypothetical protein n=1 Tax=Ferruginibacter sp. TaxID=1940288 RepID=UPI00265A8818|nr:hypothetical protein [Ferruginibacter sp.]MDB5276124.1 hypothetical protein [Ferruginibacter sp.]
MTSLLSKVIACSLLLIGCNTKKAIDSEDISVNSFPITLENAIEMEQNIGSKDISYEYTVGIDTSLYPNKAHFRLTNVKRFLRSSADEGMEYTLEYYATSDDSVRTILHEWDVAEVANDSVSVNSASPRTNIIKTFDRKFSTLDLTFTKLLGTPSVRNIKSKFLEETERDDVKWQRLNQLNAYLLMFKRDIDTYRQIRLIVYPK